MNFIQRTQIRHFIFNLDFLEDFLCCKYCLPYKTYEIKVEKFRKQVSWELQVIYQLPTPL